MKVAIPGRAMKMEELPHGAHLTPILKPAKIPFNNIEIRPPIDYLSLKADAEGGARGLDSTSLLPLPSTSNNNNNNNTNINTKGWKKTARLYRKELKAKGNIRPSTAVRRHVKKISEEFTLTQVKYENAVSTEGKDKNQGRSSSSSSSSAANNNKTLAKNVSSKITCTKCESASKPSSKTMVAPLISAIPASSSKPSAAKGPSGRSKSGPPRESGSPIKKIPSSLTPPARPKHASGGRCVGGGECVGLAPPTSPAPHRSPGRRASSLTGVSPRSKPVSFEQIKKVKMFTEKAILEGRVFSIFGYFPAIRDALRRRGWVEKMQHNVPYLNPHPNNCVCPHVGYQASFLSPAPAHHAHASSQSTATPQNPPTLAVPAATKSVKQEEEKGEEEAAKDEGVKESAEENESCTTTTTTTPGTPPPASQPCTNSSSLPSPPSPPLPPTAPPSCSPPPPPSPASTPLPVSPSPPTSPPSSATPSSSSSSSSSVESEDLKAATTATPGSSSIDEVVPARTIHPPPQDSLAGHSDERTASVTPDAEESSNTVEGSSAASQETAAQKAVDRINTAILGPSEVRRGLAESITERNATIYKYNTKHVPVKRAPRPIPAHKEEPIPEGTKGDEATQHAEEQGGAETTREEEEEAPAENEEQQEEQTKERVPTPEPYNPYVDFVVSDVDMPLVARLLRNVEPNLLWTWTRDSISFKHLSREQVVNRFPNTPFTTKYGLCETLQQLHWFSEAAGVDTFVPRGYCIGHEDERTAFIHDYRLTACLNMLKWLTERHDTHGVNAVADPHGEVPMKRVRQALGHVEQYIQSCCHDDLDVPPPPSLREHEWVSLLAAHHKIVHNDRKIKVATPNQLQALVRDCESALERVVPFWPQLAMDGVRNLWIVKPGAQSRGRGIFMMNNLEEILALVQSPLIYETKYVVQKYMERPLLIHNTKFDIRQWFLVTDWNPLHVWVYRECYLRFCSQQFDLTNNNEAVHLSNNAIQCKYLNGERSGELPEENMWDVHQFKDYLRGVKKEGKWEEVIYPGMRDALVAAMLAAQVEMDSFKHGFELFGADFMLTEDLRPWLIEINSSPCMAATTSVTRRMCAQCLQDVIKVVVDYRNNRTADTGLFELAYRDSERSIPNPPYLGVNLQVVGRQIKKGPLRPEKRKSKKVRPAERQVKPLSLITLSLEEGPNNTLQAQREPAARESSGTISRHCSILDCRKYGAGNITSLPIFPNAESEAEDEECRHARPLLNAGCDGKHSRPLLPDVSFAECDKKQN